MLIKYRGFELKAERERAMGGWDNLYYYVLRESDGWLPIDSFTTGEDTEQSYIDWMKETVDTELAKPADEQWLDYMDAHERAWLTHTEKDSP